MKSQYIWHPCSQMKEYEHNSLLNIQSANGPYLFLDNGDVILDAISSWWCKPVGHGHPRLRAALEKQAQQFEHVMLANMTHRPIEQLAENLTQLSPTLTKTMFASDGACAIEIALKMSIQAQAIRGHTQRTKFIALANAYHGETGLTLSVSDIGLYKHPYQALLHNYHYLTPLPYVNNRHEALWKNCQLHWKILEKQLNQQQHELAAIIVEPILQAAAGMKIYSADLLRRLRQWCQEHQIYLIADEIATGFGRTGLPLACQHADIEPDFLCLGKHLTGGWLPMSATLMRDDIYQLFYDDYERGNNFLHSHTHTGNALAAAVALEFTQLFVEEKLSQQAQTLEPKLLAAMQYIAEKTQQLENVRAIGAIVAADIITDQPHITHDIYQAAIQQGILLRPTRQNLVLVFTTQHDR